MRYIDLYITISIHPFSAFPPTESYNERLAFQRTNPNSDEHNELLATKWLSSDKLANLAQTEGLVFKKGLFSADEKQASHVAIERYQMVRKWSPLATSVLITYLPLSQRKGVTSEQLTQLIFERYDKTRDNEFWSEIGAWLSAGIDAVLICV